MSFLAHGHGGAGATAGASVATAILVLHVVAAVTWIAGVLILVTRRVALRRVTPIITAAATTTIATGIMNARLHIEAPDLLLHRAYGWVFLAKLGLVVLAVGLARTVRRSGRRLLLRYEASALTLAASAGVVLSLLPGLNATLPGLSVVAAVTDDPECMSQVQGAFAAVREQRPASTLTFAADPAMASGALRVPGCTTADDDAAAVASWLRTTLVGRGSAEITVVVDNDARGADLAARLGATTVDVDALPGPVNDTVVVATGWEHAPVALDQVRAPLRRVVLAPWLLKRTLLAPATNDTSRGQIAVATALDPTGATGLAYVQALADVDPSLEPTAAGLRGYRMMQATLHGGVQPARGPKLYTAVNVAFLPPDVAGGHHHSTTSGWLPIGDLAPLT